MQSFFDEECRITILCRIKVLYSISAVLQHTVPTEKQVARNHDFAELSRISDSYFQILAGVIDVLISKLRP